MQSMTGFGSATREDKDIRISAEIRSVNNRSLDVNIRLPRLFSGREAEVKSLAGSLQRGSVTISLQADVLQAEELLPQLNMTAVEHYLQQIRQAKDRFGLQEDPQLLSALLELPEVFRQEEFEAGDRHWELAKGAIGEAIEKLGEFRSREGKELKEELKQYLQNIESASQQVDARKDDRLQQVRERLRKQLQDLATEFPVDEVRLEQELIYYAEKLDITEELVRLRSHIGFFRETMDQPPCGKKLNFISQEMVREVNTIGSKANEANIQRLVVEMKDELEKIREQVQNIL